MPLTLKLLKEKLKELEDSGKINDDTIVCGYADEFDYIYPIQTDRIPTVTTDIDMVIKSIEDYISRCHNQSTIERKRKYINELKKLGHTVLLLS